MSRWAPGGLAALIALALAAGPAGCRQRAQEVSGPTCVDLAKYCTAHLSDSLNSPAQVQQNNFSNLPQGKAVYAGVPFEVTGVVQLSGKKIIEWGRTEFPESVRGIACQRPARQIHLLHGAGGVYDGAGTTIARLVLHYSDGSEREIEIKVGEHVRDWWGDPEQAVTSTNSVLAWTGTNPALKRYGGNKPGSLRVYRTSFENPQPEVPLATIDYVSTMRNSSPFLLGLTVE